MKLIIFLLVVTVFQGYSSNALAQKVNFSGNNVPLKEFLSVMEEQTGYLFFYDEDLLDAAKPVSANFTETTLNDVMDEICAKQGFTWTGEKSTITIVAKSEPVKVEIAIPEPVSPPLPPTITGKVTDEKGTPLPFVNVVIKGTTVGTSSDANGNFNLVAKKGDFLVFSFIGFETAEAVVGDGPVNVTLKSTISSLDEVQIIAYGTTTRRLNTSTIATVKSKEIESRPVSNVLQALQGQVAGVAFTQQASGIGSPLEIIVRGQNSFSSGTAPMIIVDGVVVNSEPGGLISDPTARRSTESGANYMTWGSSPLNFLNTSDIESIDILKDADATSIYGSRGSNGVILITTKKAQIGDAKYTINVSSGLSSPTSRIKRLGTADYLQMRRDAFAMGNATATSAINPITPNNFYAPDLTLWDQDAYTDWADYESGNTAPTYIADGQVTGGSKTTNYLASFAYLKKYDVMFGNPNLERLTGSLKLGHTSKDNKFIANLSSTLSKEDQKFSNTFLTGNGTFQANVPNYQMYNSDGSLYIPYGQHTLGFYTNPVPIQNMDVYSKTGNLLLSADASYEIVKGLRAKVLLSYNLQSNEYHSIYPTAAISTQTSQTYPDPYGEHTTNKYSAFNFEPMLTYDTKISKGTLSALAGGTMLDRKNELIGITVKNPGSDALLYSYASGNPTISNNNIFYYKFASLYGRLTYNWDSKYLLNLSFRSDGSSRFGPENKFGNFGSVGAGWIFSEENFIKNSLSFLSFGKIRGSYGTTGSDKIGDYLYTSLLLTDANNEYAQNKILNPATLPNHAIQWEKTAKMDVGLDLGFFDGRILFNTTWYQSKSHNILINRPLPATTGYATIKSNFEGVVQNTGMEFQLTTFNLAHASAFQWKTSFNLAFNENKLVSFPGLENTPYATKYEIGRAIPSSNGMSAILEMPNIFLSIDPANGMPILKDFSGDGQITWADAGMNEAWIGTASPTVWGGLGNYFTWKGFGLDMFIQYSKQLMTRWDRASQVSGNMYNPSADIMGNYWKQPGDVTKYPRLYTGVPGLAAYTNILSGYYGNSDATIVDGFYFRLKNVQLNYAFPKSSLEKIGFDGIMLFLRGENLAVYTKEKLYKDPELYWSNTAPMLRTFTIGAQFSF